MPEQLPLTLPHRPALGRQDYLVAPSNDLAVQWLDRWPRWPGHALALFGPQGCGKTHLIAAFAEQVGQKRITILTGHELTTPHILSMPPCPVLAVDDYDQAQDHAALFHLWNRVREDGGHLLLAGRRPPVRLPTDLKDLASRMGATQAVEIQPPDDALIYQVMAKLFADRQIAIDPGVIEYLLTRMERSFAAAGQMVETLDRAALAGKKAITISLARRLLAPHQDPPAG